MKLSIGKKLYAAFGAVVLIMLVMVTVSLRAGSAAGRGMASVSGMMINSETAAETFQSTLQMRAALGDYTSTHDPEDFRAFETHQKAAAAKLQECRETFANDRRIGLSVEGLAAVERFARAGAEIRKALTEYDRVVAEELDVIAERMSDHVQSYQTQQAAQNDLEKLAPAIELADQTAAVRILALRYQRSHEKADFDAVLSAVAVAGDTTRAIRATETAAGEQAALDAVTADLNAYASAFRRAGALIDQSAALLSTDVNAAGEQLTAARVGITESLLSDGQEVREQVSANLAASRTQTVVAATIAIVVAIALALLVSRGITRPIRVFLERFELIAGGDFTQRVECRTHDEIRDLAEGFNKLVAEVASLIGGVQNNAEQVSAAATEVAATSEQMASSTEHQRAQLTQVAAAIEEMAATVTEVSGRTGEVSRQSTEAGEQATEGGGIVRRTVEEMGQIANQVESTSAAVGQLSEKAVQIGEILTVINDIADQTNLLALNAAIEAARAGEHGRGFAVVADEVRKLAERTQEATQEVSKSIGEIQTSTKDATDMMGASKDRVSSGVELAQQAGRSLESIVKGSTTVAQSIDSIAAAVEQQSATSAEIARSIEVISAAADESTQGANQAAAAATQLSGNAESLRELVARFKV